MLRYRADLLTLLYAAVATGLLVLQWQLPDWNPWLYGLYLYLVVAIAIMFHNHRHLPLWHNRALNRISDLWFTVFQGHPGYVLDLYHNDNHHKYCNSEQDYTRTWRNRDDNTLSGFLLHPFESLITLTPYMMRDLRTMYLEHRRAFFNVTLDYLILLSWIATAFYIDAHKALLLVVLPQLFSLYWLLNANYLQHAHTDESSPYRSARTFEGWVNPLGFNIGLHTAHHMQGELHWSKLPQLHAQIRDRIDPALLEPSLMRYVWRVFLRSVWNQDAASTSLRNSNRSGSVDATRNRTAHSPADHPVHATTQVTH